MEGRLISNKQVQVSQNGFETSLPVFGLAKGIYYVRVGNTYFQKVIKVPVQ